MNGQWRLSPSFERWLYGMAATGFLILATGLFVSPQRALGSLLMQSVRSDGLGYRDRLRD